MEFSFEWSLYVINLPFNAAIPKYAQKIFIENSLENGVFNIFFASLVILLVVDIY